MNFSISPAALALIESLLDNLRAANALDGYFARESGGAYGDIKTALLTTIACAITTDAHIFFSDARGIAHRLYDETIANGESIAYTINLFNKGTLTF